MKITEGFFLQKVAEFTKLAISEIEDLKEQIQDFRKQAAVESLRERRLNLALEKAADALYKSDFITDSYERKEFLKKAKEDPSYLARTIEKLCDAADVASIGSPARVAKPKQAEEYDPVMARAFGISRSGSFVLED
jgi:hypothetical protein